MAHDRQIVADIDDVEVLKADLMEAEARKQSESTQPELPA